MNAGVFLFYIILPFIIYISILIEMYSKAFKKYLNTFAKYLYFHLNTFIKNVFVFCIHEISKYLYSYANTLESIRPQVCTPQPPYNSCWGP